MLNARQEYEDNISSKMAQIFDQGKKWIQDCAGKEILKVS